MCLSFAFATQLDPTSQIVICFLFAQPLVCKLLSVNQATNYTAAAAEWHLDLRASWEVQKNHMKGGVVADADFLLFIMKYPGPISSLANRQTEKEQKKEKTPGAI